MKINDVYISKSIVFEIKNEDNPFSTYYQRDIDSNNWQQLMGESWEPLYNCDKFEEMYQEYILTSCTHKMDEITEALDVLKKYNKMPFDKFADWLEYIVGKISKEDRTQWKYMGLTNVDFIKSKAWE